MALAQCPECSGQVSTTLDACHHCGFQLAQSQPQPPPGSPAPRAGHRRGSHRRSPGNGSRRARSRKAAPAWDAVDNKGLPPSIKAGWITLGVGWVFFALPIPILSTWIGSLFCSISLVVSVVVIAQGHAGIGIIQLLINVIGSPIVWFVSSLIWLGIIAGGSSSLS